MPSLILEERTYELLRNSGAFKLRSTMAIYHLSVKPVSRAGGRSAVAAAAYRAGVRLENERDGQVHDFTRRSGVEHAEIVLPANVNADWARDRSDLWNAAERSEKRKDARVAREFEVALPHELTPRAASGAGAGLRARAGGSYGVAVDFAIHSRTARPTSGTIMRMCW